MQEEGFIKAGGLNLFTRTWRPAAPPRGVVVIVPGFNSHSAYYGWAAGQLVASGLATYALDLRGRGRSDGERFYVERFADYLDDVAALVAHARAREGDLPIFLLGHSAGGVVGCLYAIERGDELAGFVCESFAYKVPAPDFALAVLKGVGHVAPHVHVLKLKNEHFSRDPAVVAAMNSDPLIAGESQSAETAAELVRADERLEKAFASITVPLLILHGTHDKATKPGGSQALFDAAGSTDKMLKLYDGHYHDLLNDLGKQAVMDDIRSWIVARLPGR